MGDGAKGVGEAAVGFEDADAAVNVGRGIAFFGDAGERDVLTFERVLAIGVVRRVFRGVGERGLWREFFCWFRSQERHRLLTEQIFELGA